MRSLWWVGSLCACAASAQRPVSGDLDLGNSRPLAVASNVPSPAVVDASDVVSATEPEMSPGAVTSARHVAILAPLTGPYQQVGSELVAAIRLGLGPQFVTTTYDTQGDATAAAAAVDAAVASPASFILGPVGVHESAAAVARARVHGIGIGVFAPDDGADAHAGVLRMGLSPADEARAAAQLLLDMNLLEVGVLAPADAVGAAAMTAFVAEADRLGLRVMAQGTVSADGKSLEGELRAFFGLAPATNPRLAAHLRRYGAKGWKTFSPDVAFAALYLPARHNQATLVAAFLPYMNVEVRSPDGLDPEYLRRKHGGRIPQTVQLVGDSGWHHPTLPTRGGLAVQGALVLAACDEDTDAWATFATAFTQVARRAPSPVLGGVYDGAALVQAALISLPSEPAADRRTLAVHAVRSTSVVGLCGSAAFDPTGELVRSLPILEVTPNGFVRSPW